MEPYIDENKITEAHLDMMRIRCIDENKILRE